MTRRVLVTGSRKWTDRRAVGEALLTARDDLNVSGDGRMVLVHGACPTGADAITDELARGWGWDVETHPAEQMVALGADICLAFPLPDSHGTANCMRQAEQAGIPVRVVDAQSIQK